MKQPPAEPDSCHFQTGLDAQGSVRVERVYTSIKRDDGRWYDETIYEHFPDRIELAGYHYYPPRDLKWFNCHWVVGGRVVLVGHYAINAGQTKIWFEHYDWSKPGSVRIERDDLDDLVHGVDIKGIYELAVLDDQGKLLEFRQEQPGHKPWIKWRRPVRGQSITALSPNVAEAVKAAIIEVVKNWQTPERAYCLAISYDDEGNDLFPPTIGIGLESERSRWAVQHGERLKEFVWNPAEFANFATAPLSVELSDMKEDVRMLNQLISEQGAYAKGIRVIRKVAAELGKLDWSKMLDITGDFVVYSVGTELADLEADLRACIGAKKLAALKKANLIP